MLLDAEKIVGDYLRGLKAVKDLEARVLPQTPSTTGKPWVRITLFDPANETGTTEVEWLVAYYMQLDCYAGEKGKRPEAFALAAAVRDALVGMSKVDLPDAVATDAEFPSMARIPDTDLDDGRERYVLDGVVYLHPKP